MLLAGTRLYLTIANADFSLSLSLSLPLSLSLSLFPCFYRARTTKRNKAPPLAFYVENKRIGIELSAIATAF